MTWEKYIQSKDCNILSELVACYLTPTFLGGCMPAFRLCKKIKIKLKEGMVNEKKRGVCRDGGYVNTVHVCF